MSNIQKSDSERMARMEAVLDRLEHFLLGNGQPGIIAKHEARLTKLENWRWWIAGLCMGLGGVAGAAVQRIIQAVTHP